MISVVALGIGATTAIVTLVDGVLRPLPFPHSDRLVALWQTRPDWRTQPLIGSAWNHLAISFTSYQRLRRELSTTEDVAIWSVTQELLGGATLEQVPVAHVSSTLLRVLSVNPVIGRGFTEDENVPAGPAVALVSRAGWIARYGGDTSVLGKSIEVGDKPYRLVGVLPDNVRLSRRGVDILFWLPAGQDASDLQPDHEIYSALARLKPGVSIDQASIDADHVLRSGSGATAVRARAAVWLDDQVGEARNSLVLLTWAVTTLLAVTCVNLGTLFLTDAQTRQSEISTRIAIGATPSEIALQSLVESFVLTLIGAIAGIVVGWEAARVLTRFAPARIPGAQAARLDMRVLLIMVGVCIATGLVAGLAPAIVNARRQPASVLRRASVNSERAGALHGGFVAGEVALCVTLLVVAAGLAQSLLRLSKVDSGFAPRELLSVRVAMSRRLSADTDRVRMFYDAALRDLRKLPGVVSATAVSSVPFSGSGATSTVEIERDANVARLTLEVGSLTVADSFFETTRIPILQGRGFSEEDRAGGVPVTVVSRSLAERVWPRKSAINRRIRYLGSSRTVVGVVGDVHSHKLTTEDGASIYSPFLQRPARPLSFLVRTRDPDKVVSAIRQFIKQWGRGVAVVSADPITDLIERSIAEERYRTVIVSAFASLAVILAMTGVYGVVSRNVEQRRKEIAIRACLGSGRTTLLLQLLKRPLIEVTVGASLGIVLALAVSQAMRSLLIIENPGVIVYIGVLGVLGAAAFTAASGPALRLIHVEPARILRGE